jgi:hypothetical protein
MADTFIEAPAAKPTESQLGLKPVPDAAAAAAAKPEIKASELSKPAAVAPVKKGSVKESIFADLRKKFGGEPDLVENATPKEGDDVEAVEQPLSDSDSAKPETPVKEGEKPAIAAPEKKKEYKGKVKEYEAKLAELEKTPIPAERLKEYEDKVTAAEKRAKELDEQIKYVDYTKSTEFQEKYQKPYEESWKRSMSDLSEITVATEDGERPIEGKDLLDLVNLPLKDAKALADEKFGDYAQEVMAHRKEIRKLFEEQSAAIEAVKKDGAARQTSQTEAQKKMYTEVAEDIKKTWSEANQSALADEKHGIYFKPVDGDQEGNQRLSKGFELADRAFSENPMAPGLTPEQRREIVKRHAAVRNRCAAFGRLAWQNQNLQTRIKEMETELKGYKDTEPTRSGSAAAPAKSKGSAWGSIREELAKRATR